MKGAPAAGAAPGTGGMLGAAGAAGAAGGTSPLTRPHFMQKRASSGNGVPHSAQFEDKPGSGSSEESGFPHTYGLSLPGRRFPATHLSPELLEPHPWASYDLVTSQKTESPVSVVNRSRAATPATEFPRLSSPGLHTQTVQRPGTTATMPPPTPLLPGSPTR